MDGTHPPASASHLVLFI